MAARNITSVKPTHTHRQHVEGLGPNSGPANCKIKLHFTFILLPASTPQTYIITITIIKKNLPETPHVVNISTPTNKSIFLL